MPAVKLPCTGLVILPVDTPFAGRRMLQHCNVHHSASGIHPPGTTGALYENSLRLQAHNRQHVLVAFPLPDRTLDLFALKQAQLRHADKSTQTDAISCSRHPTTRFGANSTM